MTINDFISKFAEAVEIDDASVIDATTNFRDLEDWNSLAALSVISMFEEELDKDLAVADFKQAKTIQDLYDLANA